MAKASIVLEDNLPIDWNATGEAQVLQNVRNLLSTRQYEVAYDRGKGIDPDLIDRPSSAVLGTLTNEINELLQIYEPRAALVALELTANGKYQVKVKVTL